MVHAQPGEDGGRADCSRSAVQQACDLLVETGWIEFKLNGRGGTGPDTSEQPFAAKSYRVRIDRDDLPPPTSSPAPIDDQAEASAASSAEPPIDAATDQGGASQVAGGASRLAGGATMLAPLEGNPSKGISLERERARPAKREAEEFGNWLAAFLKSWPTAAADDQARIASAGRALDARQRKAALDRISAFLAHLKAIKRTHTPAGWRYLEQRSWEALPDAADTPAPATGFVTEGGDQFKLWKVVWKIARPRSGIPSFKLAGAIGERRLYVTRELPIAALWIAEPDRAWRAVTQGSQHYAAWHRWLIALLPANLVETQGRIDLLQLTVPAPWPPRVDGSSSPDNQWPADEVITPAAEKS
jgi:hypothetical protein